MSKWFAKDHTANIDRVRPQNSVSLFRYGDNLKARFLNLVLSQINVCCGDNLYSVGCLAASLCQIEASNNLPAPRRTIQSVSGRCQM